MGVKREKGREGGSSAAAAKEAAARKAAQLIVFQRARNTQGCKGLDV